ncbi:hypothetical protein BSLG_001157 [Batrachochytrium salamandrivorans]|nr:hypothetical protein BSLG_001157 [Batrachochytrium salamandrivorans]
MRYMMIIDKVIQQIVLQRDGEDPDPVAALANLDMRHLVGDMTSTEILKDQEEKYQKQLEKSKRLEKEITNLNRDMEIVMKEKLSTVAGGDALLEMFKEVVQSIANPHPPAFGAYAASAGPKAKATNLSSKPLKSFNWTKLPPMKVKETIWANIDDEEIHKRLRGDVYSTFEDMFAAREIKSMDSASASKEDISVKEYLLDGKRSQNCNIMLKAVKLDPKLIKRAILTVDTDTLPRFVLAELLKFIPTDDEITALKQYTAADLPTLASAERFMFEISEIENYEPKLKAMHFKTCFGEYEDDAETLITGLQKASEDVMNSKKFTDLLKVILALEIISTLVLGGAYGFKIGSLLKMMDTKSTVQGRKHTLLHYLTELVDQSFPNIQGFEKDLIHVEEGSKEEFFGTFSKFTLAFLAAKADNETAVAKERELKKREEAKKRSQPSPAPRQRRAHPREGTRGADGSRDGSSTSDGHGLEGLQTQLQRNVMRETSNSHLRDKSFQNAEQGAVGRLRRQGSFKDRASLQQRDTERLHRVTHIVSQTSAQQRSYCTTEQDPSKGGFP